MLSVFRNILLGLIFDCLCKVCTLRCTEIVVPMNRGEVAIKPVMLNVKCVVFYSVLAVYIQVVIM